VVTSGVTSKVKTSELHEWLLATKEPQLELSPGARIDALMPVHILHLGCSVGRTTLDIGHLAYQVAKAAKRHSERGHAHRVMINRGSEVIADGIPTDYPELAGWEELTFDKIPAQIAAWGKVGV
jgi:hypothetical protein